MIPNPEYKGEWKAKMIKNPAYKGIWVAPDIDNPDYVHDDKLYNFKDLKFVGFELWQVRRTVQEGRGGWVWSKGTGGLEVKSVWWAYGGTVSGDGCTQDGCSLDLHGVAAAWAAAW